MGPRWGTPVASYVAGPQQQTVACRHRATAVAAAQDHLSDTRRISNAARGSAEDTALVRLHLARLSHRGRASAILELTWDRVDFERGQIRLAPDERRRMTRPSDGTDARWWRGTAGKRQEMRGSCPCQGWGRGSESLRPLRIPKRQWVERRAPRSSARCDISREDTRLGGPWCARPETTSSRNRPSRLHRI